MLKNPPVTTNTILDIAMASAFNSKSAFYTAFKENTGITPLQSGQIRSIHPSHTPVESCYDAGQTHEIQL